ncbi:integrin alpha-5-like isoform X2 [Narcine bancroftii]|uniref:integrin alpha-5-like isoform X2 n=1 Tax=Narcine bancroftii TaxID=1343680 RepID=UPI003831A760
MRLRPAPRPSLGVFLLCCRVLGRAYNLDSTEPSVYSGPAGSYFGFSVDFSVSDPKSPSVLVGAPRANTSQPNITESGAVYSCPWGGNDTACWQLPIDLTGDRLFNDTEVLEEKSNQWLGATIRSQGSTVLACAPRYTWRENLQDYEMVGTCFISQGNHSQVVEYSPCRTNWHTHSGQGFCQAGFSADLTESGRVILGGPGCVFWEGQLVSAYIKDILPPSEDLNFIQFTHGEIRTGTSWGDFEDSYLGYSLAVGEFNGDFVEDFVTGVPRGTRSLGHVTILNGTNMKPLFNFTGEQMASYFGYAVSVSDVNGDGWDDVLVGAPMFMQRDSAGRLQEVGRVHVYLQTGLLQFNATQTLTGEEVYGRFGTSLATLGDLDQDGYNDMAVGAPYSGPEGRGLVFVYNGSPSGLRGEPSQVLEGRWAAEGEVPAGYGFSVRGATDLDLNGYPDVIVGAFGVSRAAVYRSRPVVRANASLKVTPSVFNPDERYCTVNQTHVSCVNITYCLSAFGPHLPGSIGFLVDLHLDARKQKGSVKRMRFLHSQEPSFEDNIRLTNGADTECRDVVVYLLEGHKFRDKLSPIHITLNFSLDTTNASEHGGLQPMISSNTITQLQQEAFIELGCGDDNICVPDLHLSVQGDRHTVFVGAENPLTLTFQARNLGEGGAYEAELHAFLPPEAHFSGIVRDEGMALLSCTCENLTLVCNLGNPLKPGAEISGGFRFSAHRLRGDRRTIQFDLQIHSKNQNNSRSELIPYPLTVEVSAHVDIRGVSIQDKIIFPIPNWEPRSRLLHEEDVGPAVKHIFELSNDGPSSIGETLIHVSCPLRSQNDNLLYVLGYKNVGASVNCTSRSSLNPLHLKLKTSPGETSKGLSGNDGSRQHSVWTRDAMWNQALENMDCRPPDCLDLRCRVARLDKGANVVLTLHSRVWAQTFVQMFHPYHVHCNASFQVLSLPYRIMPTDYPRGTIQVTTSVLWTKSGGSGSPPLWVVVLSALVGLVLLSALVLVLYKLNFFNHSKGPYGTATEKAHLKPQGASEA